MTKPTLDQINVHFHKSNSCGLKSTAQSAVYGVGSASAQIVFIGEAPGKKEDEQGRPFIGASGKMLDALCASITLVRSDVYITNVVKYRPPENRDPSTQEVSDCLPWLIAELDLIKPLLVIPLGRHALGRFAPDLRISDCHGTLLNITHPILGTLSIYPLYHPAAALYNGSLRETLFVDFARIPILLTELTEQ